MMEELLSVSHYDAGKVLSLEVWEQTGSRWLVRVMQNGKPLGTKTFKDTETRHYDAERWLNDRVGYPNPFYGILSNQMWE
jgi:hypothetical protein